MNKFFLIVLAFLFSAASFAQAQEEFQSRANQDNDHPWTTSHNSNRFTVWYSTDAGDCASLTTSNAQTAANELENIYEVFVHREGFPPPYAANATKYKMGAYVLRNGTNCANAVGTRFCGGSSTCNEGHAFGGTIGNPAGPGMWLSAGAVSDKWALAHEFMHGLQAMAGGMNGGNTNQGTNFRGWLFESHANLMPHLVYPTEVHYCAEMYTRTSNLYLGSTRNRYCNWQFFEYLIHRYGTKSVNDIWTAAQSGSNHDPFTEFMYKNNRMSQKDFNDVFGDFATKAVIWEINKGSTHPVTDYKNRGSALFRAAFNKGLGNPDEMFKRPRYTYLEALDGNNAADNRYVVPFAVAPQRYGYNIIRLYPNAATGTVTVSFRGDAQTKNNIANYTKTLNLEPAAANLPDNPGSDWRYGLVAVTGDASATGGTVTARYSDLMRASDGNPDVSIQLTSGESLYLVVAATPTIHHKISWDQFYYTVYRFPYMVEIKGAKPEGFQAITNPAGANHSNGGGFVQSTAKVDATAYVGPNARVLGNAQVTDNARIEGRAVVKGNAQVKGNAVVKDHALVAGGQIYDRAVIAEGANIYNAQVYGDAHVDGAPTINNSNAKIYGNGRVGGVCWITSAINVSGTAQILGDGEVYEVTATKGVFFGLVDAGAINDNQQGANRTAEPVEVTAPRSMKWYGEPNETNVIQNLISGHQIFNLNSSGIFSYNLGSIPSANLKIYDSRGKLLKIVRLSNSQGTVDIGFNATQVLLWKVEGPGGRLIGQTKINALVR